MADIRKAIYDELGFTCSAGISVNKMAAKFIAGLKKPNAQDRISHVTVSKWAVLELKVRGVSNFSAKSLRKRFIL